MSISPDTLSSIGNTPTLQFTHLDTGKCQLFGKLEYHNPGGSIKDRIALSMINRAEQQGVIHPGDHLFEATAGNTGMGLVLVAKQKGYRLTVVMPDKMSQEKADMLVAMGATVVRTRSDVEKGHPDYYQDLAQRLCDEAKGYYINQFANPANYQAHIDATGPEIWHDFDGKVDAVVCAVGSGGTLTGLGRYLKSQNPEIEMVLADPEGSILADIVNGKPPSKPGSWLVEGGGEDFVPDICDLSLASHAFTISDQESFSLCRHIYKEEGILVGTTSGMIIAAALKYCQQQTTPRNVVCIVCDTGYKYLTKIFNDAWWQQHGLQP